MGQRKSIAREPGRPGSEYQQCHSPQTSHFPLRALVPSLNGDNSAYLSGWPCRFDEMMLQVALVRMGTEFDFPFPLPSLGSLGNASTMSTLGSTCLL